MGVPKWTVIATTGDRFDDFAPFVPSVDDTGCVCFQAALRTGGSGVFVGDGTELDEVAAPPAIGTVTSHPDLNSAGTIAFYGTDADGVGAVFVHDGSGRKAVASVGVGYAAIGPLGPTMNEHGAVAWRADPSEEVNAVLLWDGASISSIADTSAEWSAFQGLPVVAEDGGVIFRGDRRDGSEAIVVVQDGIEAVVAETGEQFASLARFPCSGAAGAVAFAATLVSGGGVVVVARGGEREVVDQTGAYESFRGVVLAGDTVVRIATPRGEDLGLFSGPDPVRDRILAMHDPLLGSTVADFAANPVSVSAKGLLAVRATLADGRQVILRTQL